MSIHRIICILALLFILSSASEIISSGAQQQSIHLNMFSRDSVLSPLSNTQESSYDKVKSSFLRSKIRLAYLLNQEDILGDLQGGDMEAEQGEYLVKFSIGTPPVETLAVVDMANQLVLTRCNNQTLHIYDSSNSFTYKNISCNSSECHLATDWACDSSNLCSIVYGSPAFAYTSSSLLGSDVFTFESSNGSTFGINDVIFGCKYYPQSTSYTQSDGILGLGFHNLSLIMQMSSVTEPKFTYCLGNRSDPEAESRLVLGNGVFLEGQTTPLNVINGQYGLELEGISVGTERLKIPPQVFQRGQRGGGVIIDTGTMLTFLAPDAYSKLVDELEEQLGLETEKWADPPYQRCYKGDLNHLNSFQGVTLHFGRGVNIPVDAGNLFLQVEDGLFCLGVLPSLARGPSILGSLFQQSYCVGYNLRDMLVSFHRVDSRLLEKHLGS